MAELLDRTETGDRVEFTYQAELESSPTTVTFYKTNPPTYTITPSTDALAGKSWQDLVAQMDTDLGG